MIGYDNKLRALSSLSRRIPPKIMGINFDTEYEVQTRAINTSNFGNNGFIDFSAGAEGTSSIAAGTRAVLTTTLTPDPKIPDIYTNFAIPFISIYEGANGSDATTQFYPGQGSGIAANKLIIMSGYDKAAINSNNSVFRVTMYNNIGTTINIFFTVQWKYTDHGKLNP